LALFGKYRNGMTTQIHIDPHPLLEARAFTSELGVPLGTIQSPEWLLDLLRLDAPAPLQRSEEIRSSVRDLLRHGGYKPTGRGKPASEYLLRAATEGTLSSINAAVDACNVVSLASGLPISLVDLDLARPPFRIGIAPEGANYVFNASGQTIDLEGLLSLFDAGGACANAVKDSQRTKTHAGTTRTLSIIWGVRSADDVASRAEHWYRDIIERLGGRAGDVALDIGE
jgi:DNA/RNA-binding domain of Phe-tRNA-synthetase-like protein